MILPRFKVIASAMQPKLTTYKAGKSERRGRLNEAAIWSRALDSAVRVHFGNAAHRADASVPCCPSRPCIVIQSLACLESVRLPQTERTQHAETGLHLCTTSTLALFTPLPPQNLSIAKTSDSSQPILPLSAPSKPASRIRALHCIATRHHGPAFTQQSRHLG